MADRIAGEKGDGRCRPSRCGSTGKRSAPVGIGEHAARLQQHRRGPRDVPERGPLVVDEGERAGRDIAERERGRAGPPQPVALEPARDEGRHAARIGRADGEERARSQHGGLDAKRPAVEPGALPDAAREELARERIVDDARPRAPVAEHADRHREAGHAATEVVGAVDRVDDPHVTAGGTPAPPAPRSSPARRRRGKAAPISRARRSSTARSASVTMESSSFQATRARSKWPITHAARAERQGHRRLEARIRRCAGRHATPRAPPAAPRPPGRAADRRAARGRSRPDRAAPARSAGVTVTIATAVGQRQPLLVEQEGGVEQARRHIVGGQDVQQAARRQLGGRHIPRVRACPARDWERPPPRRGRRLRGGRRRLERGRELRDHHPSPAPLPRRARGWRRRGWPAAGRTSRRAGRWRRGGARRSAPGPPGACRSARPARRR